MNRAAVELYGIQYKEKFNSKADDAEVEHHFVQHKKNELRMEYIKEGLRPEIRKEKLKL